MESVPAATYQKLTDDAAAEPVGKSISDMSFEAGDPIQTCWLVSTIEDCRLVARNMTAEATVFQKWYMKSPRFLDRVLDEHIIFKGGILDGMKGQAAVDIIKKNDKEMLMGVRMSTVPTEIFPVNQERIFGNLDSTRSEPLVMKESVCWIQYTAATKILAVQLNFHVHVHSPVDFQRFPFDRHVVPFPLELRAFKDAKKEKKQWVLPDKYPEWAKEAGLAKFPEDKDLMTEQVRESESGGEFNHMFPTVLMDVWSESNTKPKKPVFCVRLQRSPRKFILSVVLPIFMIVLLALSTFFSGRGHGETSVHFAAILTSALTVTTFRSSVLSDDLPSDLTYLTTADWYLIMVFLYHVLMAARAVYRSSIPEAEIDTTDDTWYEVFHALKSDFALALIWLVPHVVFIWALSDDAVKISRAHDIALGGGADDDDIFTSMGARKTWPLKYKTTLAALERKGKTGVVWSFSQAQVQPAA